MTTAPLTTTDTTPEGATTTTTYDVCLDPAVTNKICGPATVGSADAGTPEPDTCLNLGNGVGQTSRSLQPCDLPSSDNSLVLSEAPCQEDEACWDCTTMGNHLCGPQSTTATVSARLPSTGTTSAPMVGGALTFTVLGVAMVLGSLRRKITA